MQEIDFEWDADKAKSNFTKHGVTFTQAATVFSYANTISVFDKEHSLFEDRWHTIGYDSDGNLLAISHTYVDSNDEITRIRIISARSASKQERRIYEQELR